MANLPKQQRQTIGAFHALRALACWGVFLFHLNPQLAPNAYQGVTIFFVLAGFLAFYHGEGGFEHWREGWSKLGRKVMKLWPPLILTILASTLVIFLVWPEFFEALRWPSIGALLGVNNYVQLIQGENYFQSFGFLKPLTHLWALSLEWQWYVLDFLVLQYLRRRCRRGTMIAILGALTVLSLAFAFLLFVRFGLNAAYYDFFSRLSAFSLGALGALCLPSRLAEAQHTQSPWAQTGDAGVVYGMRNLRSGVRPFVYQPAPAPVQTPSPSRVEAVLGWAAYPLLPLLVLFYFVPLNGLNLLPLSLLLYALPTVLLTMGLVIERGFLPKFLGMAVWRYFASRSYCFYLTHYPVLKFAEKFFAYRPVHPALFALIVFVLAQLAAELLYRLTNLKVASLRLRRVNFTALVLAVLVLLAMPYGIFRSSEEAKAMKQLQTKIEEQERRLQEQQAKAKAEAEARLKAEAEQPKASTKPAATEGPKQSFERLPKEKLTPELQSLESRMEEMAANYKHLDLDLAAYEHYRDRLVPTLIGDSVSVIVSYWLPSYWPRINIDAKSLRQWPEALKIYEGVLERGELGDVLIMALGTNSTDAINPNDIERVYNKREGRPFLIVNIVLPFPGQEQERNKVLETFVKEHKDCYLVDWHAVAKTHPEFFQEDNIHPSDLGCQAFSQMLSCKMLELLKEGVIHVREEAPKHVGQGANGGH